MTTVDQNRLALEILQSIVRWEDLDMPVGLYDINALLPKTMIDQAVVLMFLEADPNPAIIL